MSATAAADAPAMRYHACVPRVSRVSPRVSTTVLAAALAVAVGLAAPAPALAGPGDYDLMNPEWNGLSQLTALAEAQGLSVVQVEELDWDELEDTDLLFMLYPTRELEPSHITSFLRAGGRLLLADDFGRADPVLARLGVLRRAASGVHPARWHEDNPALPIARAAHRAHALAEGADELVTNHPAVFTVDGPAEGIYGFGEGEVVVAAGELGDGRFVALADPSVIINGMLAFDGNLAFTANLLHWLMPPAAEDQGAGRVVIVAQGFDTRGAPPDVLDEDVSLGSVNKVLRQFGKWLDELNDYIASPEVMRGLGVAFALAVLLGGALVLPFRGAGQRLDGAWTRAPNAERPDFEQLIRHYDAPGFSGSYAYPAAVLRDAVDARLGALIDVAEPLTSLAPDDLLRRIERRAGPAAATALYDLLDRLRSLPARAQAQTSWGGRIVSRHELDQVYDGVQALERTLGHG